MDALSELERFQAEMALLGADGDEDDTGGDHTTAVAPSASAVPTPTPLPRPSAPAAAAAAAAAPSPPSSVGEGKTERDEERKVMKAVTLSAPPILVAKGPSSAIISAAPTTTKRKQGPAKPPGYDPELVASSSLSSSSSSLSSSSPAIVSAPPVLAPPPGFPGSMSAPPGFTPPPGWPGSAPPGFPGSSPPSSSSSSSSSAFESSDPSEPSASVKAAIEAAKGKSGALPGGKKRKFIRAAAGKVWEDETLSDWPDNDFRIFCGDLGNEVNDNTLGKAFSKFASFNKAKVIRDKRTNKTKGFGFVSFLDPFDCANALREMNGKYIGNRPVKLRKSEWGKRDLFEQRRQVVKAKKKAKAQAALIEAVGMAAPATTIHGDAV